MARRVAAAVLLALCVARPGSAFGDILARAGIAQAMLGRWQSAFDFFEAEADADRAARYFAAKALLELAVQGEALSALRGLSDSEGAFAGPALELAVARLFEAGLYDEVVQWAEASTAKRFQDPDAFRYRVGQAYVFVGRPEQALPFLEAVSSGPHHAYAQHTLGLLHFSAGRLREAVALLGAAVETAVSHPDPVIASALADRIRVTRGRVIYQLALEGATLDEAERQTLFSLAGSQFARVVPASPLYADALRGVGWCALESDEPAQALAAFGSAASLAPGRRHEDLWAQGRVYQRQGYPDEAARVYGEARAAALAEAERLESGGAVPEPGEEVRRWETVLRRSGEVRERSAALAEEIGRISAAIDGRGLRLDAADGNFAKVGGRARSLVEDLDSLAASLASYLDQIPASKLFRPPERPRLQNLLARQEWLALEIAHLEAAFAAFGASRLWLTSSTQMRTRTETQWSRLQAAKESLARAQLGFLEALKQRVSIREAELVEWIEELRSRALALNEPVQQAGAGVARAQEELEGFRARLSSLARRRDAVSRRMAEIEAEGKNHREDAVRAAAAEAARRLRLRADAYALDETQALHLFQEGAGRGRSRE